MSQHTPDIHLEIFAPSFSLPTSSEEHVQAQLLFPSTQQVLPAQEIEGREPHIQQGPEMRQLRSQNIPAEGQAFLLQVLRQWRTGGGAGVVQQAQLTDEMAITLEVRTGDGTPERQSGQAQLIPGVNRIVILLDQDGRAESYSIDSAES